MRTTAGNTPAHANRTYGQHPLVDQSADAFPTCFVQRRLYFSFSEAHSSPTDTLNGNSLSLLRFVQERGLSE
jgi:hypothetical protein